MSERGLSTPCNGRPVQTDLDMQCPVEFKTVPDCDCPFEHWHVGRAGCCLDVHVEEEGYTHAILSTGDDEFEKVFHGADTLDKGRPLAMSWAATMIGESYE